MITRLILLAAVFLAVSAQAQTIKSLGFNTTNGRIVAATNVVWTNAFSFSTNTVAAQVRTNLGLGATWLTNTNVTNFRTAIGLGATNNVQFESVTYGSNQINFANAELFGRWAFDEAVTFVDAATTRTNLGLGLPALTNTSNVTTMRALAGSTNASQPFTGSFTFVDDVGDVAIVVVSNGIIVELQFP